jgi:hypothetical protein
METGPSASSTRRWLSREARALRDWAKETGGATEDFVQRINNRILLSAGFLRDLEGLAAEQGFLAGRAAELQGLYRSATAYYVDEGRSESDLYEDDDAREIAAWVIESSTMIDQQMVADRLDQALARARRCRPEGALMLCE